MKVIAIEYQVTFSDGEEFLLYRCRYGACEEDLWGVMNDVNLCLSPDLKWDHPYRKPPFKYHEAIDKLIEWKAKNG